jgi:hypothetical protein
MEQIRDGADALGFQCKFREDGAEGLLSADLPCIVSVDGKYSVLSKINGKSASLHGIRSSSCKIGLRFN